MGNFTQNTTTLNFNNEIVPPPEGSAVSPDGGVSLILTGVLDDTGLTGEFDFFIDAAGTGMVAFDWSFSNGIPGTIFGGYLLGADSTTPCALCTTLSSSNGSGVVPPFMVTQGELFGFFVVDDNQGQPGVLTITDFSAPSSSSPVPEPGTATMLVVAGAAATLRSWRNWIKRNRGSL